MTHGRLKRDLNEFLSNGNACDLEFVNDRIDCLSVVKSLFEHCTFSNISFKQSKIIKARFTDCIFIDCYFRRCDFSETNFIGCKFIGCSFPRASIQSCNYDYSTFKDCFILFEQICYSLPHSPNLREDLLRNLSVETAKLGHFDESNRYRKEELIARENNLWAAFIGENQWYRDHYDCCRRFGALFKYITSILNGFFFGYGQYFSPLIRNLFISVGFFWCVFYLLRMNIKNIETGFQLSVNDALLYSIHNILPTGINMHVQAIGIARLLAGAESLWGVILAAFVASFIFRWSLNK